jgi:hypothetical protein
MSYLSCILDFLEAYNGAVTAVATVVMAGFTIVLAYVTGRQARLTKEAVNLGRSEFIASHRPRFEIREPHLAVIHCPADPPEQTAYQARFILANSGESEGTLVESVAIVMEIAHHSWTHFGVEDGPAFNMFGPIRLAAGAHHQIVFGLSPENSETASRSLAMHQSNQSLTGRIFLRGYLAYVDANGTRRRTAFCRPLDLNTKRFVKTNDPDYDYCD